MIENPGHCGSGFFVLFTRIVDFGIIKNKKRYFFYYNKKLIKGIKKEFQINENQNAAAVYV